MQRELVYVLDIINAAEKISVHIAGLSYEEFARQVTSQSAVVCEFIVMGEATKRLPMKFRARHPEISWKQMAQMRDVLVHNYDQIKLEILWNTIQQYVPKTIKQLKAILEDEGEFNIAEDKTANDHLELAQNPELRDKVREFCQKWQVEKLETVDSLTHHDSQSENNLDLLATFAPDAEISLFDLEEMEKEMESYFPCKVYINTRQGAEQNKNWVVLESAQPFYEV